MQIFGLNITRAPQAKELVPVHDNRGWLTIIRESFPGAWQRNVEVNQTLVTSHYAMFACMTLIASDISKLRVKFMREKGGIWQESKSPAYDPVLRRPNQIQNHIQFWEGWILSKLMQGNTYVLKGRNASNVVNRMWVLDPNRVQPLISESGDVFYQLDTDNIAGLSSSSRVFPASEIIHDRMNCLFHPLVGLSPIYAAGLAATQGLSIQNNSTGFFANRSIPGGILTSPHTIPDATADRLKRDFDMAVGGANSGKTAVLGDGLEFKSMGMTASDAQMLEQSKATAEWVCSAFHVPPYKVGVGAWPAASNVQALNVEYYSQCLQSLIEAAEECLDQGLEMGPTVGVEFDIDGLLRMDTASQVVAVRDSIGSGAMSPNEARQRWLDLPPTSGGETPYLQQQNYSLAALAKRDAKDDPFAAATPPAPATPPTEDAPADDQGDNNAAGDEPSDAAKAAEVIQLRDYIRRVA